MLASRRLASLRSARPCLGFVSGMSMSSVAAPSGSGGGALAACLAVTRTGEVALNPSQTAPILERPPASGSKLRTIVLNRPKALNAIDLAMVETLHARIAALDDAPSVDAIVISAVPGRAFCAGGDIKTLYDAGEGGDFSRLAQYFRAEYTMDWRLGSLRNSHLISLLDGIVMGGGVGMSIHGRFRVATENTLFAMPENSIGLMPDCGVSYVLGKLPGGLGAYLSLTGARLKGSDVFVAGLATHYVPSHLIADLEDRLGAVNVSSPGAIARAIAEFTPSEPLPALGHLDVINECFSGPDGAIDSLTAETIVQRLEKVSNEPGRAGAEFAKATHETILKCCPMSVKVSLEALKRAKKMSTLAEALQMDFRLGVRMSQRKDFYAGVKSAIVTKDRNPLWNPSRLSDIDDEEVQKMFEPLSGDIEIEELSLPTESGLARM